MYCTGLPRRTDNNQSSERLHSSNWYLAMCRQLTTRHPAYLMAEWEEYKAEPKQYTETKRYLCDEAHVVAVTLNICKPHRIRWYLHTGLTYEIGCWRQWTKLQKLPPSDPSRSEDDEVAEKALIKLAQMLYSTRQLEMAKWRLHHVEDGMWLDPHRRGRCRQGSKNVHSSYHVCTLSQKCWSKRNTMSYLM